MRLPNGNLHRSGSRQLDSHIASRSEIRPTNGLRKWLVVFSSSYSLRSRSGSIDRSSASKFP